MPSRGTVEIDHERQGDVATVPLFSGEDRPLLAEVRRLARVGGAGGRGGGVWGGGGAGGRGAGRARARA
ncbi:hypothetical protein, partial [Streptomyces sp. NPDC059742]|uniref:hypothetical protein n=1 Tax=Streptomyces sp. NPDC059742 TaxID=3346927 RepID=UPI003655B0DC